MGAVNSVSTAGIPVSDRISFWTTGASKVPCMGTIDASPLTRVFEAEAATRQIGSLLVFGLKAGPHRVVQRCRRDNPVLKLRYQRSGEVAIEQRGRRKVLRAGDWTVIDGTWSHTMVNADVSSHMSLHLPCGLLSGRDVKLASSIASPALIRGSVGKLLFDCLRFTLEDLGETSEATEHQLSASILEMFRAVINDAAPGRVVASSRDTVEQRVREYINRNLSDPSLSVETIASAMGCSARYIHKIFEGRESVTRMIWSLRLERCRLELMTERASRETLTELAYEFGFSSSAHFSRAFKDRYGVTPSAFRLQAVERQAGAARIN